MPLKQERNHYQIIITKYMVYYIYQIITLTKNNGNKNFKVHHWQYSDER